MGEEEPFFNNGFITALALFYGHFEWDSLERKVLDYDPRIRRAADHLHDIDIPENLPAELRQDIQKFVDDVIHFVDAEMGHVTKETGEKLFEQCRNLLMEIDRQVFGLKVIVNYR